MRAGAYARRDAHTHAQEKMEVLLTVLRNFGDFPLQHYRNLSSFRNSNNRGPDIKIVRRDWTHKKEGEQMKELKASARRKLMMWLSDQKRAGTEAVVLAVWGALTPLLKARMLQQLLAQWKVPVAYLCQGSGWKNSVSHRDAKLLACITGGLEFELTQPTRVITMRIDPEFVITLGCLARAKANQLRWALPLPTPHRIPRKTKSLCKWAHN